MPLTSPPNVFQTYLTAALAFRPNRGMSAEAPPSVASRSETLSPTSIGSTSTRRTQNDSIAQSPQSSATSASSSSPSNDISHESFLSGSESHLRCSACLADLCLASQIISKGFTGRHGPAYLISPDVFTGSALTSKARKVGQRDGTKSTRRSPQSRFHVSAPSKRSASQYSYHTNAASNAGPSTGTYHAQPQASSWAAALPRPFHRAGPFSFGLIGHSSSRQAQAPPSNLPNTHTHRAAPRTLVTGIHTVSDVSCAGCGSVLGWKYVHAEKESQKYKIGKFILETKRIVRWTNWEMWGDEEDEDLSMKPFQGSLTDVTDRWRQQRRQRNHRSDFDTDTDLSEAENSDSLADASTSGRYAEAPRAPFATDALRAATSSGSSSTTSFTPNNPSTDLTPHTGNLVDRTRHQISSSPAHFLPTTAASANTTTASQVTPRLEHHGQLQQTRRVAAAASASREVVAVVAAAAAKEQEEPEEDEIEFDSQDEDECEDLFNGRWTKQRAKTRREGHARDWAGDGSGGGGASGRYFGGL